MKTGFLLATHLPRTQDPFLKGGAISTALTYLHVPMIDTRVIQTRWPKGLDHMPPEWVFFTSAMAVRAFVQNFGPTPLLQSKLAAVGEQTSKALNALGLRVDFCPDVSEASGAAFAARQFLQEVPRPLFGAAHAGLILWPCGTSALPTLAEILREEGWQVEPLPLYETIAATVSDVQKQQLLEGWHTHSRRAVMFTSPSTVLNTKALFQSLGLSLGDATCLVIGETTANALLQEDLAEKLRLAVRRSPWASLEGLLALVEEWQAE